jgi:hypothetical protein
MSALVPEGRLEALQHDPRVKYVVEDMIRNIDAQSIPTGIQRIFADTNPDPQLAALETRLTSEANQLGIGPMASAVRPP